MISWLLTKLFPPRLPRFNEKEYELWRRDRLLKESQKAWERDHHGAPRDVSRSYKPQT